MSISQTLKQFLLDPLVGLPHGSRILVACSGGPDSVALARALKTIEKSVPFSFRLGHINHQLRAAASKGDQAFVTSLARELGWPVMVKKAAVDVQSSGNLEEKARVSRYKALVQMAKKTGCKSIFTAHNLDDQVETVLMNLSRGSGLAGLSGMSPTRIMSHQIVLARPLLRIEKNEILAFLKKNKARFRKDKSNQDQSFTRNWLRKTLIPMWQKRFPQLKDQVANLGQISRDEQNFWDRVVGKVQPKLVKRTARGVLIQGQSFRRESIAVQRRLLRQIAGQDLLTFDSVERLRRWMSSPPSNGRLFQLRKGWLVERLSRSKGSLSATTFRFCKKSTSKKGKR